MRGWGLRGTVGARGSTHRRFDALRPVGNEGLWPRATAGVWVESGPLVAVTRLQGDLYLKDDPDGIDPEQRRAGRSDHAYVALQFPIGELMVGRLRRNWSALGSRGLMVSNNPFPYSQIGFAFRFKRFSLQAFTGELDTVGVVQSALGPILVHKRYIAAHRLDYSTDRFGVSFGESIVYGAQTGAPLLKLRHDG